jgi:hypothetical protein
MLAQLKLLCDTDDDWLGRGLQVLLEPSRPTDPTQPTQPLRPARGSALPGLLVLFPLSAS